MKYLQPIKKLMRLQRQSHVMLLQKQLLVAKKLLPFLPLQFHLQPMQP
jgi:hypothetical protein